MMSSSHEKQPSVAGYPPQPEATAYPAGPPAGYPIKDGHEYPQNKAAVKTKARGNNDDGFWKGFCSYVFCCHCWNAVAACVSGA